MEITTRRRITSAIAAERREPAALLDALPVASWDAPTLCAGWRVREVAAHMSMGFLHSLPRTVVELVKARGSLHRMTNRCARRDAAAFSEPALGHDVVHGLDITVALGLDRRVPEDLVRVVPESVTPRSARFFGARLDGVQLRADDLDWSFGTGSPLYGAAQDLLLVAFGRRLPPGRLRGEELGRFVSA
ncbi:maleylpyruvate isomerase N-terminal domain-containing protein [Streptomyces sp. NPDC000229]|uniref:maleylpyruvate isomerase N-terminal domain-containing protein n=1 Tax=Streptomyces sp. NPDC000229 TaxID=3154247 RepID=UPI00332202BB